MTAYVDLGGELRAAFKSLRQRGPAGSRFRAAGREDVATGTTERPAQERGRRAERVIRTLKAVFA